MILGDSHVRGLSGKLKETLNGKFEVIGYAKPNCDITLTNSAKGSISTLTKNDVLAIRGGANDVAENNTKEGLRQILNFVRTNNHTNIVLLCLPYRHDLIDWSCVNKEITVFNRKLLKIMKCYEHVTVIQHDLNRDMFTKHGLHLNALERELIVKHITAICNSMFQKALSPSVCYGRIILIPLTTVSQINTSFQVTL